MAPLDIATEAISSPGITTWSSSIESSSVLRACNVALERYEMQPRRADPNSIPELPDALKIFLLLSVALTALSFVYTLICRSMGLGLPYSFPYYYVPGDMYRDFYGFQEKFHNWGTPAFFEHAGVGYFMYPAPLVHVFRFLFGLPHARSFFLLAMLGISAYLTRELIQILRARGLEASQCLLFAGSTAFLSYPLALLLQRGNIEVLVWLVGSVGVWCFLSGRSNAAAICIGVAASLKFYPFIFLGLFLPRRRYGGFLLGIATFAAVTLLSLYGLGPTVVAAERWSGEQIAAFSKYFVGSLWSLGYDHSFFGLVKAATLHWHPDYFAWARPYSIVLALLSVALYFGRIWRLPLSNQVLALTVLSVTLAPISYDYTLLNLYPAFAMLAALALQGERETTVVPHLTAYMVLFALILTPESYIIVHGDRFGAQLRALCLIAILVLSLKTPLPELESGCVPLRPRLEPASPQPLTQPVAGIDLA
jgi:Glycosyltransferase family 87